MSIARIIRSLAAVVCMAALLTLASQNEASAQMLWQGAESGMSPKQVAAIFNEAMKPSDPARLGTKGNPTELLRIKKYTVGGTDFSVHFYFVDQKLMQVTLSALKKAAFGQSKIDFDSIVTLLRAKYGQEISNKSDRGILNSEERDWITKDGANISLYLMAVGLDSPAVFNINYQSRISAESGKL